MRLGLLKRRDGRTQGAQRGFDLLRIFISPARPEKALQAVPFSSGDDVHMKMGNALAYHIIDGYEGASRLHSLHDSLGEEPDIAKDRAHDGVRQIKERLDVALDDEKRVAREERAMIQEGERNIVLENLEAGHAPAKDVTKRAVFLEREGIFHLRSICREAAGYRSGGRRQNESASNRADERQNTIHCVRPGRGEIHE